MDVRFKVHGVTEVPVNVQVEIAGQPTTAQVKGLEVELISEDLSGSVTLRFVGNADIEAARALYVQDSEVVSSWSPAVVGG